MRQPRPPAGGSTHIIKSLPSPVGGWNARDPLAKMDPRDAIVLENWFPRVSDCAVRGGCADHVTGFAQRPKTLAVYNGLSGTNKLWAFTDSGIFDASSAGAVGASVLARTNGYHMWVQMAVSGGSYLMAFNGTDGPAYYDGTSWQVITGATTPALSGVTLTDLVAPNVYKRRLFILEKNKLNFWYLAADAVGGALTEFLLGPLCQRGGYTMAMGTWSLDGGGGPDDYAAFVTSEGEVLVFTGTNPSSAADWLLIGVFYVGKPLGRKCFKKYGGDLLLLTEYGAFPLSKAVQSATIDFKLALSNKIENAFISAARTYGANTGFCMEILPQQGALIINIPTVNGGTTAEQYVMNTTTRSWCKFTGWNISDMVTYNKELYFADATKVSKGWTSAFIDYSSNIIAQGQAAFTNFGDARTKDFGLFRPILRANASIQFSMGIAVDFETYPGLTTATYNVVSGALWDVGFWDQSYWAAGLEAILDWRTPGCKPGEYGGGMVKVATNSAEIQWAASEYSYILGGAIT